MAKKRNLTGMRFGKLFVLELSNVKNKEGRRLWKCICDCQLDLPEQEKKYSYIKTGNLTNGKTNSCGCIHSETSRKQGLLNKKYNTFDIVSYQYGVGWTNNGYEFWFDKEDYDLIKDYCWSEHTGGYLRTCDEIYDNGKHHYIMLHQLISKKYNFEFEPDHINGKTYDNRKENLRDILHINNAKNTKLYNNNTSRHKGICWNKNIGAYQIYIQVDNERIHLGYEYNYDKAVEIRESAELKYFGEYNRDKEYL